MYGLCKIQMFQIVNIKKDYCICIVLMHILHAKPLLQQQRQTGQHLTIEHGLQKTKAPVYAPFPGVSAGAFPGFIG